MRIKRRTALVLSLLLAFTLTSCGYFGAGADVSSEESGDPSQAEEIENGEYPLEVNGVTVPARPVKVLSLAPALTEQLADLGFADRLMGVSDFCDYPDEIIGLPRYGTAQIPDITEIVELSPHVILTGTALELSDEAADLLAQRNIAVVVVPHAASLRELTDNYIALAQVMEGKNTGRLIGEKFVEQFESRLDALSGGGGGKIALYLRMLQDDEPDVIATGGTLESELLERIGYVNVAADQADWFYDNPLGEAGLEAFRSVEMIFMDERYVTIRDLEQSGYYKSLPATIQDLYLYIDCVAFERQGLRMLEQLEHMAAAG